MLNFLAFDSNKFALYFTPITLFVFLLIIIIIMAVYYHKIRKSAQKTNKKGGENAELYSDSVKTVYSNKSDNFSQTENLPVPENFSTNEFDFEFAGWDKYFVDENGQFVTQAIWTRTPKEYTVKIFGRDENTPIAVKKVNYGSTVDLMELMPEKEVDENYEYTFIGWDSIPTSIECDTEIHALFEVKNKDGEVVSAPSFGLSQDEVEAESLIQSELDETQPTDETEQYSETETNEENSETAENDNSTPNETTENQTNVENSINEDESENEEVAESFDDFDLKFDNKFDKNDDDTQVFNNIKVGKPAITHGVDTTVRSKNGYKIETSNSIYNAFSINVDNKSTNFDSDDIFKRAGVGVRGVTPGNSSLSDSFDSSVSKPSGYKLNRTVQSASVKPNPEPVSEDSETEQFFKNTMLVNHRKTIKK